MLAKFLLISFSWTFHNSYPSFKKSRDKNYMEYPDNNRSNSNINYVLLLIFIFILQKVDYFLFLQLLKLVSLPQWL